MSLGWGVKLDLAKEMIDGVILRAEQMGNTDVLKEVEEDADNFAREIRLLARPPGDRSRAGGSVSHGQL